MKTKVCNECKKAKVLSEFYKHKGCKYGVANVCKSCRKIKDREWREKNRDKIVIQQREWRENHKDEVAAYNKQYQEDHKDEIKEYNIDYRKKNKKEIAAKKKEYHKNNPRTDEQKSRIREMERKRRRENSDEHNRKAREYKKRKRLEMSEEEIEEKRKKDREYYYENSEKIRKRINDRYENDADFRAKRVKHNIAYTKKRNKVDPLYKFKRYIRKIIRNSFVRQNYKKKDHSENILGCTLEFFKEYIEGQFVDGMTWDNTGEWHLDHIIPLKDAETEDDVIKLCHYTNFQPLWSKDNLKKSGNRPDDYQFRLM